MATNLKQVIVVRKDLKMRQGKACAQVAHAAMKVFFDRMTKSKNAGENLYKTSFTKEMEEWMKGAFTKVVVSVDTEDQIYQIAEQARLADIPYAVIIDNGLTEFKGQKTVTCVAVGPAESKDIDKITGSLQLI